MESFLFNNYARWDIEIVAGTGTTVIDANGKEYADFTSGIGVCNLGHCHPEIVRALTEQAEKIWHTSNLFVSSLQEEVAAKLVAMTGENNLVFFCNSGAEANEAAMKLARKYTEKTKIITFEQSFHGRTFGTMAATGQEKVKIGFGKMLETFVHLPFNDIKALEQEIDTNTAAVMIEVVQGEGGIHPADEEFLLAVEKLCKDVGALFIVDEVQTGIGRTGKAFAYQHYSISPDIITLAKGLGSGFPVGAMIGKETLSAAFNPGSHGSTFGGNPLAMAAAKATLKNIFNQDFLQQIEDKGNYLYEKLTENLSEVDCIKDIRHKGLMFGIECTFEITPILSLLRTKGLLVLSAGTNVVRLLPPLTVTYEEIDFAVEVLSTVLLSHNNSKLPV